MSLDPIGALVRIGGGDGGGDGGGGRGGGRGAWFGPSIPVFSNKRLNMVMYVRGARFGLSIPVVRVDPRLQDP